MLHSTSVKTRFLVSVGSNGVRGIIGFISGIVIARSLSPSGYGDLMFLLGSFIAIRSLLDMGTSSAFYTFISQRAQSRQFYLFYFGWLGLQFVVTLALVALIIPTSLFDKIWLGHPREIVLLAFLAAFMQQHLWQMIIQIGEARRKTVKMQLLNLVVAITYLAMVFILSIYGHVSVEVILLLLIGQYAVAATLAVWVLKDNQVDTAESDIPLKQLAQKYWAYCKPLLAISVAVFLGSFADNWMLQQFGGAVQQGYFQIASQFAQISLLATISILNIFWKEVADAWEKLNYARAAYLYRRVSRGLVMLGAIVTGLLLPWSEQIVSIFLGQAYSQAWPVLAIMLIYPIHQSMGQIGGVMLAASGHMQKYMVVGIAFMLISLPIGYLVLAPATGKYIPGFELGAIGMAIKMVLLGIISVNLQAWIVARYCKWEFDWIYQVVGIPLMLGLGYLAKTVVWLVWGIGNTGANDLIVPVILTSCLYGIFVVLAILSFPWLAGIERGEILRMVRQYSGQKV